MRHWSCPLIFLLYASQSQCAIYAITTAPHHIKIAIAIVCVCSQPVHLALYYLHKSYTCGQNYLLHIPLVDRHPINVHEVPYLSSLVAKCSILFRLECMNIEYVLGLYKLDHLLAYMQGNLVNFTASLVCHLYWTDTCRVSELFYICHCIL